MSPHIPTAGRSHGFFCDGQSWAVDRYAPPHTKQVGLRFRLGSQTRFLLLSRGTVPTERELSSITDAALGVLMRRAQPQRDRAVPAGRQP